MYCPNCAAPIEGVKFCRGCGTNVALVPQAMSGELAELTEGSSRLRHRGIASVERAASTFFSGVGFVLVALAIAEFMPGGASWWFWMLIPAFTLIGTGVGQYLRVKADRADRAEQLRYAAPTQLPSAQPASLDVPRTPTTSNLGEKASVTEDTTRHLR